LPPTTAATTRFISWVSVSRPYLLAPTPPAPWRIARIGIGRAIAPTPPSWFITRIGISGFQRTTATRHTAPIARFIIGVSIGLTAAALFAARLVFAW
jgi:hypothetical protein